VRAQTERALQVSRLEEAHAVSVSKRRSLVIHRCTSDTAAPAGRETDLSQAQRRGHQHASRSKIINSETMWLLD